MNVTDILQLNEIKAPAETNIRKAFNSTSLTNKNGGKKSDSQIIKDSVGKYYSLVNLGKKGQRDKIDLQPFSDNFKSLYDNRSENKEGRITKIKKSRKIKKEYENLKKETGKTKNETTVINKLIIKFNNLYIKANKNLETFKAYEKYEKKRMKGAKENSRTGNEELINSVIVKFLEETKQKDKYTLVTKGTSIDKNIILKLKRDQKIISKNGKSFRFESKKAAHSSLYSAKGTLFAEINKELSRKSAEEIASDENLQKRKGEIEANIDKNFPIIAQKLERAMSLKTRLPYLLIGDGVDGKSIKVISPQSYNLKASVVSYSGVNRIQISAFASKEAVQNSPNLINFLNKTFPVNEGLTGFTKELLNG